MIYEFGVPKLNSNDVTYVLVEWLVADGQPVLPGDPLVVLETSKAAEEIPSPQAGIVRHLAKPESECEPGQIIATIAGANASRPGAPPPLSDADVTGEGQIGAAAPDTGRSIDVVLTEPARALAQRYGLTDDQIASIPKRLVRAEDVEQLRSSLAESDSQTAATGDQAFYELSANQQQVARRVAQASQSIPAAFAAMKVRTDALSALVESLASELGIFVGLPELVLRAAARLRERFPAFFGRPCEERPLERLTLPASTDIGVTIDVGTGLFIPVIKNADAKTLREIASAFMRARTGALRGQIAAADRGEPAMVFAVSTEEDLILSVPLIFPGTVCTLVLTAVQQELRRGPDDSIVNGSFTNLGLSYDHRYINGRDAIAFLRGMRDLIEAPSGLASDAAG